VHIGDDHSNVGIYYNSRYKILALNCLISAFSLAALYSEGIKYGDTQVTIQSFLIAGCFMFLSYGKPIEHLSSKRPQPNIFNFYILFSVLGQFFVHSACLWYMYNDVKSFLPEDWSISKDINERLDQNAKFQPNIINTVIYLISLGMQVSTFLINYQGRPFRESLRENKPLFYSLTALYSVSILGAAQIFPSLNESLELERMEARLSDRLTFTILLDLGASYMVEYLCNFFFSDNSSKSTLGLKEWLSKTKKDKKKS
jgi:cation-transporting ATPase 13A1